ncbi:MAG: phosphatidylserine/phosphatidylglycerophosphate/cardiolipin synthase family protein [Actinomycetota bacterium]|nr:phosphatidylserine/phosphatidylglycerophosphate/cardiolipin synthase family protein [Actinomycetota bacterium]
MIESHTLSDGGQDAAEVETWLIEFIDNSNSTLDIAIYDIALSDFLARPLIESVTRALSRGVKIRLAYNVGHDGPIPVPPPSRTQEELVRSLGVPTRAIPGTPDLMHQKYVVSDGGRVWAGSTNWTDDSWTREENVIVVLQSQEVAGSFSADFEQLWGGGQVDGTGFNHAPQLKAGNETVRPWFCPKGGKHLVYRIAGAIYHAERRVRICSPVVTAGQILGTLLEVAGDRQVDVAGACDATQMQEVLRQWHSDAAASWKIPAIESLAKLGSFSGKHSTPYAPGAVHDYMHAKVTVADDTVFVGSYNLSHSGQENAENVLEIESPELADHFAAYIDVVRERYPALAFEP